MNKIFTFFFLLFAAFSASADSYMTIGTSDTILLHPNLLGNAYNFSVRAHYEGRLDYWHLTMSYPSGLTFNSAQEGLIDMQIPYVDRFGRDTICEPELVILQDGNIIMSSISEYGYYPTGPNTYDTYGTVKWEAGDYPEMFKLMLVINNTFRHGVIGINGILSSNYDFRGGTIQTGGEFFYKAVTIHVGYKHGDVNGDGSINAADVTLLINLTLSQGADEFQLEAGDMNGDGSLTTYDVTALISYVLANGGTLDFDPSIDI